MGNPSNHPADLGSAIAGQETTFAQFLEDNRPHMTAQLSALTGDVQLAEDLYQDTVLHLWEKRQELASLHLQQPQAWLWTCVHNRWRAYRTRETRRQELRATWQTQEESREEVPFVFQQWLAQMEQIFARILSPVQQEILHLIWQGFPPREIAQQLNLASKQVHQQIYLSRKKLKPFFVSAQR